MTEYYNFKVSEFEISYEPYWYDKSNILLYSFLGIIILALGIIISVTTIFKAGIFIAVPLSCILFCNSTYRLLVKNKTQLIFDKQNDALYAITPLGKRKLVSLSTIINLTAISGSTTYCYVITKIKKGRIKNIPITTLIIDKDQNNPEIRFLEIEMIPQITAFLNINTASYSDFKDDLQK
jgi:MFS superfamily sulfate permease-like transporter